MHTLQNLQIEELHSVLVAQLSGLERAIRSHDAIAVNLWSKRVSQVSSAIASKRQAAR
jgi:hypothetical protein